MSFSCVFGAQITGLKGNIVRVEVDRTRGLHAFTIVGLPGKAVEESRERVSSAIKNSGFENIRSQNQKIILSLSPSDLRKDGPSFDLSMAIALLLSSGELCPKETLVSSQISGSTSTIEDTIFVGELSLDGVLRPTRGILPIAAEAKLSGFKRIVVPRDNAAEAALAGDILVFGAGSLQEVARALSDGSFPEYQNDDINLVEENIEIDFVDIGGQESAKRALTVAAAGGHNVLMHGPPGSGKTMLAKAFSGILPPLVHSDALTVTSIHSVVGRMAEGMFTRPPLRTPHHSSSLRAIIGGGSNPKPGEITLAHKGVLFLDEFPEFDRRVIEGLREPIEERSVTITRTKGSETFPADFILIAAMNPCPCGYAGTRPQTQSLIGSHAQPLVGRCQCAPFDIFRYRKKISGPILDRIDITLAIEPVPFGKFDGGNQKNMTSLDIQEEIKIVRERQRNRLESLGIYRATNARLSSKELIIAAPLSDSVRALLATSAEKLGLSARGYHRTLRVARTIADIDMSEEIKERHILEALQYRSKIE